MLQPKRVTYRRQQKGKGHIDGVEHRGTTIAHGSFAIKSLDSTFVTNRQIEAARIAVTRAMKREGNVWIRIFPDKPITRKPAEVRMGSGKGAPEGWVAVVKAGRVLFEVDGVSEATAREALSLAAQKLPVRCKFMIRPDYQP